MNILACFMLSSGFTESAYAEISTIGLQKLFSTVNGVVSDSRVIFFLIYSQPQIKDKETYFLESYLHDSIYHKLSIGLTNMSMKQPLILGLHGAGNFWLLAWLSALRN